MSSPAPDAVGLLIDARDMTALSDRGRRGQMSDISDRVPSPAYRKVFLSGDYQAGTRDWGLGTGDPNPNPKHLAPNPSCAVLGQVYEQFLDKVIRLTAGHQAEVGEKPEVRRGGGVLACA